MIRPSHAPVYQLLALPVRILRILLHLPLQLRRHFYSVRGDGHSDEGSGGDETDCGGDYP